MRLQRLHIDRLRSLQGVEMAPGPGLNWVLGPNGAGKTSVLEAAFLLSHGRSFRRGARGALLQRGAESLRVVGLVTEAADRAHRLGLGGSGARWDVRIDGERGGALAQLLRHCAVVCFEPGTHRLIAGGGEERRQFLDWGVFHVEHAFLRTWQRYRRAWRQRNALLRSDTRDVGLLVPWEQELAATAARIDAWRGVYLRAWEAPLQNVCADLVPELGPARVLYRRGWDADRSLEEVLAADRDRDRARGYTRSGPHRADWQVSFEHAPQREHLSRGQEKLCALACVLAQAEQRAAEQGDWPIVCLDDLGSELDAEHQAAVLARLPYERAQVFVTGTTTEPLLAKPGACLFHVEQGRVTQADPVP